MQLLIIGLLSLLICAGVGAFVWVIVLLERRDSRFHTALSVQQEEDGRVLSGVQAESEAATLHLAGLGAVLATKEPALNEQTASLGGTIAQLGTDVQRATQELDAAWKNMNSDTTATVARMQGTVESLADRAAALRSVLDHIDASHVATAKNLTQANVAAATSRALQEEHAEALADLSLSLEAISIPALQARLAQLEIVVPFEERVAQMAPKAALNDLTTSVSQADGRDKASVGDMVRLATTDLATATDGVASCARVSDRITALEARLSTKGTQLVVAAPRLCLDDVCIDKCQLRALQAL